MVCSFTDFQHHHSHFPLYSLNIHTLIHSTQLLTAPLPGPINHDDQIHPSTSSSRHIIHIAQHTGMVYMLLHNFPASSFSLPSTVTYKFMQELSLIASTTFAVSYIIHIHHCPFTFTGIGWEVEKYAVSVCFFVPISVIYQNMNYIIGF